MFPERLKQLRNEQRLSQRNLAEKLQISQQSITAWETGRSEPTTGALAKIANFFGVSADYLLGQTNERKISNSKSQQDPIEKMLDEVMSSDGQKPTENDREILRGIIEAYLKNKK